MSDKNRLKELAESVFTFDDYAHYPNCNYAFIIEKMLDFHSKALESSSDGIIGWVLLSKRSPKECKYYNLKWANKKSLPFFSKWEGEFFANYSYIDKSEIMWLDETPIVKESSSDVEKEIPKSILKEIIQWTEWLGEMGWYFEKGKWLHDDETGRFNSTEDLVNHYLGKAAKQSSAIVESEEKKIEPEVQPKDLASVASHSCTPETTLSNKL